MIFFSLFIYLLTTEPAWSQKPPKDISLPSSLKHRSAPQIKSIFSSLQNLHNQTRGALWWLKIQQAFFLKEKEEVFFCKNMKELSTTSDFPLQKLALIYFYESCPLDYTPEFKSDDFPEWLQSKATKSFYRRYTKYKNTGPLLEVTIKLIERTSGKELKTSYIKQAINLAKKLNDPRLNKLKEQLFTLHPELKPEPSFSDYIPIAHSYRKSRSFKKSIHFYRKALNSPQASFKEKNTCFKNLKKIYKLQRSYGKYLIASKQWSQWLLKQKEPRAEKIRYQNELSLARHYWTLHSDKKALNVLDSILVSSTPDEIKGEIYWMKGVVKIKADKNEAEEGLNELSESIKFFKKSNKQQRLLEKALWNRSWTLKKLKKYKEALKDLSELERIAQNPYVKLRATFWKSRALKNLNKQKERNSVLRELIEENPYSYYGLMARKELGINLDVSFEKKTEFIANSKIDSQAIYVIPWLISLDEDQILQSFLRFKNKTLLKKRNKTIKDWKLFLSVQTLAKQYLNIFYTFSILKKGYQKYFWNHHIDLFFPLEFHNEIAIASKRWDVPEALILAIIRQESAFNPKARSPADAFGLMQMIPSTARSTAMQTKTSYSGTKDLYDPLKNITWGSFYIKKLLKRYDNSFIFSLAAYNAGGTPVKKWKTSLDTKDSIEFIENIPYEETRVYVKLLIRNFLIYNKMLNNNSESFPKWVFEINEEKNEA